MAELLWRLCPDCGGLRDIPIAMGKAEWGSDDGWTGIVTTFKRCGTCNPQNVIPVSSALTVAGRALRDELAAAMFEGCDLTPYAYECADAALAFLRERRVLIEGSFDAAVERMATVLARTFALAPELSNGEVTEKDRDFARYLLRATVGEG
jgi:hypothetical protein